MKPIQTKSKVIVYFPNTGVFDAIGELIKQSKISLKLSFDDLILTERALTDEEIVDFNLSYRIGYEGYYKVHGEYPTSKHYNVNFVEDSKNRLICALEINRYDYIFIEYKPYICNWLDELKIDYYVVYPDNELKENYIFNILVETCSKYKIKESEELKHITNELKNLSIRSDKPVITSQCRLDITDTKLMNTTWDQLMDRIEKSNYKRKIILQRNHYLKDILDKI